MAGSVQDPAHKALPSLLPSLLGLLFERSFAATVARPAYVEAAANCSTTGGRRIVRGTVLYGTRDVRFKERPDWVGLSARDDLPRCSPRLAKAVADARTHIPGRRKPLPTPGSMLRR